MSFNINDNVQVKLTEFGKQIHKDDFDRTFSGITVGHYHEPVEDEQGWSTWQMWTLMKEFGPHISMTGPMPFATEIKIAEKR